MGGDVETGRDGLTGDHKARSPITPAAGRRLGGITSTTSSLPRMRTRLWAVQVFTAAGLLLTAACGGGTSERSGGDSQVVDAVGLEEAFASAAGSSSYRITQSSGQTIRSGALGDSKTKIDEDHPTVVGEVTPDATHISTDLTSFLRPFLGGDVEQIGFEIWTEPGRIVVDTRNYAGILENNPDADLGPLEPGIAYIDLATARVDSPDLVTALVGQGLPDLVEMAARLPDVLSDVERSDSSYTGKALFADLLGAMGADAEQMARSTAAGLSLNLDIDPDAFADFYVDYYGEIVADVSLETDTSGAVRSVRYEVDLSDLFTELFKRSKELGLDAPEGPAARAFTDTVWMIESLIRFEVVDDLAVEQPPATSDNRTDEWVEFLRNAGF